MRSNVTSLPKVSTFFILILFAAIVLSMSSVTQGRIRASNIMARVVIRRPVVGGSSNVTFDLFKLQSRSCCDACKLEPKRPCRKCCNLLREPDYSVTLTKSGTLKFENVSAGTYLLVNEIRGKPAGLEQFIDVNESGNVDLGKITIDSGFPLRKERGPVYRPLPPPKN